MQIFLCHNGKDTHFVVEIEKHLKRQFGDVYCYEVSQRADQAYQVTVNRYVKSCNVMVVFIGRDFTPWQAAEATSAHSEHLDAEKKGDEARKKRFFLVRIPDSKGIHPEIPAEITTLGGFYRLDPKASDATMAYETAAKIVTQLGEVWHSADDLPLNAHLFSYEKDIIDFFKERIRLGDEGPTAESPETFVKKWQNIRGRLLEGCPDSWPEVVDWRTGSATQPNRLDEGAVGKWRADDARVVTAALRRATQGIADHEAGRTGAVVEELSFPEAGPRERLYFPRGKKLRVAVMVSGGIAPGINAVIDGITQRHWLYAEKHGYKLEVQGLLNGLRAFDHLDDSKVLLTSDRHRYHDPKHPVKETSDHANEGGSILGTSRCEDLINPDKRIARLSDVYTQLATAKIDILYIIGGDGSMKAAHALWSIAENARATEPNRRRLSVVAIPKTMDNDILWVWQSFGFLSAVEKAREVIEILSTEVRSNPRLCVVQLFGSDSGFVVSHAVLASAAGHCDVALIPEIRFSMDGLASYLKERIDPDQQRIPHGLVVMAETAIPTDAMDYVNAQDDSPFNIGLSDEEKGAIREFNEMRAMHRRIQGQTNDALRTAGMKIVSRGLLHRLRENAGNDDSAWEQLRVLVNEPRHLLRAIPPSCSDVIIGHRLGTLAVDNAMAGYTDFMISQWLTEYVLVPLKLVVLGRKRIPESGIFWKSVVSKTAQPHDLEKRHNDLSERPRTQSSGQNGVRDDRQ